VNRLNVTKGILNTLLMLALTATWGLPGWTLADEPAPMAFCVGKVLTMNKDDRVINNAVVLVRDGKIERLGPAEEIEIPKEYQTIERPNHWLVPGLVEAHNHSAGSMMDLHDYVYLTNAGGMRTLPALLPESADNKRSLAGGVTTAHMIPGSGNNHSGFGTLTKLAGKTVDEMLIKSPGSLKLSQAGNPERYWYGVARTFMYYNLRQTLEKAKAYHEAWKTYEDDPKSAEKPEFDIFWDDFRPVFAGKTITLVHTQWYQVVMSTLDMMAKKLDMRVILGHSTFEAYMAAPLVKEYDNVYTSNGPRQIHFDRRKRKIMGNAARWWQGGVRKLSVNTDAPVLPQEELPYQAAMACYFGWKPYEALRGITRISAEQLMLEDQVGSIGPGMDADLGLWTGDPIDPRSACEMTVVDGKIVYDAEVRREF